MKPIISIVLLLFLFACAERKEAVTAHNEATHGKYTCPMHPAVVQDAPGNCPICGMDLVLQKAGTVSDQSLMLSTAQLKLANVTTQAVRLVDVGKVVPVNGRLVVNEEFNRTISSRMEGRIEKLYHKEVGKIVRQGEVLYELYSEKLLTLEREYLLAKEQYQKFGSGEPRYASFLKAAEKKLVLYGMQAEQIKKLNTMDDIQPRIAFHAPVSGIIKEINALEGQYVGEGDVLYQIENISQLWLEADLYGDETRLVKRGDKVSVIISGFESEPAEATVLNILPEVRTNTQVVVLRAALFNPQLKFRAGQSAQVLLRPATKKSLAVPVDAVIRDAHGTHVYVLTGENTFEPRPVKTGIENFDAVEITEGLHEGEVIAVTGAYLLYSEIILKKGINPSLQPHPPSPSP
jgi:Cu(I)/Ag(I) efflux system membrane fusion protein